MDKIKFFWFKYQYDYGHEVCVLIASLLCVEIHLTEFPYEWYNPRPLLSISALHGLKYLLGITLSLYGHSFHLGIGLNPVADGGQ